MKIEVAVLGSPSLMVIMVSVDVTAALNLLLGVTAGPMATHSHITAQATTTTTNKQKPTSVEIGDFGSELNRLFLSQRKISLSTHCRSVSLRC